MRNGGKLLIPMSGEEIIVLRDAQYLALQVSHVGVTRSDYVFKSQRARGEDRRSRFFQSCANRAVILDGQRAWLEGLGPVKVFSGDTIAKPLGTECVHARSLLDVVRAIICNFAIALWFVRSA